MKNLKKLGSIALALVMVMAMMIPAFAAGTNTITVNNAAKGETYTLYKVFNADVVTGRPSNTSDGITYSYDGELPSTLSAVFEKDTVNDTIKAIEGKTADDIMAAVKAWADTATPVDSKPAEGGSVTFIGLDDGYYAVLSTVSNGNAVTITSIAPNATVYDKNDAGTPTFPTGEGKTANGTTFDIGDTVTYTVKFNTVNWIGTGDTAKRVTNYTISDTATSGYLGNVTVTGITIDGEAYTVDGEVPQFVNGAISFPWTNVAGNSLYDNEAQIVITYTATVTGTGAGNNQVSASYTTDGDPVDVPEKPEVDIYNSTIVVDKVNGESEKLAGAQFILRRLPGTDETPDTDGYVYYSIANNDVSWGTRASATPVTTDNNGAARFEGLKDGSYELIETVAPAGYNLKADPTGVTVSAADSAHAVSYTSTIENNQGAVLPSTGGMGTTIFYAIGGILLAGSAVLFVTKKRMGE